MHGIKAPIMCALLILIVSTSGYSQAEMELSELINMSFEELLNVEIVTAGKTAEKIEDIPASIVIVTRDEIETHGFTTLADILDNIPGMYSIDEYAEGGRFFGVRGFWSSTANENLIILVNDVPQTKNTFSNHPLAQIPVPVEAIDRIELVRGPMSVIYGDGAFFGAINIITNSAENDNPGRTVVAGAGTGDTEKFVFRMSGAENDLKFTLNASYYDSYGIDEPASKMMSNPEDLLVMGVPLNHSLGGHLEENYRYLDFSVEKGDYFAKLVVTDSEEEAEYTSLSVSDGNQIRYNDVNISGGYRGKITKRFSLNARLTYYKERFYADYNQLYEDSFGIQDITSSAFETAIDLFYDITPELNITAGIQYHTVLDIYNFYDLPFFGLPVLENSRFFLDDDDNITRRALYYQAAYRPVPKLQFVTGGRFSQILNYGLTGMRGQDTGADYTNYGQYDHDHIEFIPRFAAIYKMNEKNVVKILYGKALSNASFFQNYLHILEPGRQDLDHEFIETYELNYLSNVIPQLSLNLSVFYNSLDNLIQRYTQVDENGRYIDSWFANTGKMHTTGLEVWINTHPFRNLSIDVSGSWQKTEDRRSGYKDMNVSYSPELLGYIKAKYLFKSRYSFAVNATYVDKMLPFWDDTPVQMNETHFQPNGYIGKEVGSYIKTSVNFRMRELFNKHSFLNVNISNLFDTEIRYPTFTNNPWADRGTIGLGRQLHLTVGYTF